MSIASTLTSRVPALQDVGQTLRASPAAYQRSQRTLWIVGLGLIVLAGLLPFYQDVNKVFLTQQVLYLGLLALSLNFLVNTVGLISFGHAMFMAFGAYTIAVPFKHYDWSPLIGIGLAPIIGGFAAFFIGFIVFRGKELYFALLTLGVGQLVWAVAHGTQNLTGGQNGIAGVFAADWLNGITHSSNLYWFIFLVALGATGLLYIITKSPFGDACRGIRENRRRAEFAGIAIKRYELLAFVIAGTFGAIAGSLFVIGESNIVSTQIDWNRSAQALIVVLIGGFRYFLGPFAGAVFFVYVQDTLFDRTQLWDTLLGIVVLLTALLLPGGLAGMVHFLLARGHEFVWRLRGIAVDTGIAGLDPSLSALSASEAEAVHLPDAAPAGNGAVTVAERNGTEPILKVTGVSKAFGGLQAVDDASIDVLPGSLHAIIGPNGAGKTTFFNLITGLLKPDSGQVFLEGEDVTGTAPWRLVKRGLGRSFQQTNLFWALSSLDNVTLAEAAVKDHTLRLAGGHSQDVRKRSRALLDRVGLGQFSGVAASELSHGDQRSLEIATALAVESKLLLLDEPTAGLSPAETKLAVDLVRRIATEQGLTVLFVEHDMEVVFRIADYITVLYKGAVLAEGPPAEIRASEDVQRAYLGELEDEEVQT